MTEKRDRFDGLGGDYVRFRPAYPASLIERIKLLLAETLLAMKVAAPPLWIDVGCGTGIFTRQVARMLPPDSRLVGLEPSADMRAEAERSSKGVPIDYHNGTAEALPVDDATVSVISAATAAHWFDRPRFYAEAARVLTPGGLLLIVQYVRNLEGSPAAAALEAYFRETGGPKAYERPDYAAELSVAPDLKPVEAWSQTEILALPPDAYVGLALSSSHAAASIERTGSVKVRRDLERIAQTHVEKDGTIPFGYRFELFAACRMAKPKGLVETCSSFRVPEPPETPAQFNQ